MKIRILILLSMAGLMLGCQSEKEKQLARQTIDSLRSQLQENHQLVATMTDVGVLLDSIDINRKVLRANMLEGTHFENYSSRMRELNRYVKETEQKIAELEKSSRRAKNTASYTAAIKKLREELDTRNQELLAVQEQVSMYRNENDNLIQTVSLQKAEIEDKLTQLKVKQDEASKLEEQVKQLMVQSKIDEGEAYFLRAAAVEETARRTKFAPRKKKNTRKEALELYRLALFYGKDEAQSKIDELERKL